MEYTQEVRDLSGEVNILSYRPVFKGPYSTVYHGRLKDSNELVAIKVLSGIQNTALHTMRRKIERERQTWSLLRHPNILPLYGFADDDEHFQPFGAFISPWCQRGDMAQYIQEQASSAPLNERLELWKGVVAGVTYSHTHDPLLVHGDLKPRNILIDDHGKPLICDFGLVKVIVEEGSSGMTTTTAHTGTLRYLAYELITEEEPVPTMASDIYATGCIGLETIFGKTPYSSHGNGHNLHWHMRHDIQAGTLPATRPDGLSSLYSRLWEVIIWCWAYKPSLRPRASALHEYLEHVTEYPNLDSNSSDESESGDTEEDHTLPPHSLSASDASTMAMQLAPDNTLLRSVIQALLQGDRRQEIQDEISALFDLTSNGPRYTCGLFKRPGRLCAVTVDSSDRFKHHLQSHLAVNGNTNMLFPGSSLGHLPNLYAESLRHTPFGHPRDSLQSSNVRMGGGPAPPGGLAQPAPGLNGQGPSGASYSTNPPGMNGIQPPPANSGANPGMSAANASLLNPTLQYLQSHMPPGYPAQGPGVQMQPVYVQRAPGAPMGPMGQIGPMGQQRMPNGVVYAQNPNYRPQQPGQSLQQEMQMAGASGSPKQPGASSKVENSSPHLQGVNGNIYDASETNQQGTPRNQPRRGQRRPSPVEDDQYSKYASPPYPKKPRRSPQENGSVLLTTPSLTPTQPPPGNGRPPMQTGAFNGMPPNNPNPMMVGSFPGQGMTNGPPVGGPGMAGQHRELAQAHAQRAQGPPSNQPHQTDQQYFAQMQQTAVNTYNIKQTYQPQQQNPGLTGPPDVATEPAVWATNAPRGSMLPPPPPGSSTGQPHQTDQQYFAEMQRAVVKAYNIKPTYPLQQQNPGLTGPPDVATEPAVWATNAPRGSMLPPPSLGSSTGQPTPGTGNTTPSKNTPIMSLQSRHAGSKDGSSSGEGVSPESARPSSRPILGSTPQMTPAPIPGTASTPGGPSAMSAPFPSQMATPQQISRPQTQSPSQAAIFRHPSATTNGLANSVPNPSALLARYGGGAPPGGTNGAGGTAQAGSTPSNSGMGSSTEMLGGVPLSNDLFTSLNTPMPFDFRMMGYEEDDTFATHMGLDFGSTFGMDGNYDMTPYLSKN